jgi:Spy/CpxP family protein refolding chaperone
MIRVRIHTLVAVAALLAGAGGTAAAQRATAAQPTARPPIERLAAVVQRRLRLNAAQSTQLRETTRRFAAQRQDLMAKERETRRALRAEIGAGDAADQQAIARHLDTLVSLQQRRVQLVADEQRDLARFLSPLQRAQFLALQERAFRAAQQLRMQRARRGVADQDTTF